MSSRARSVTILAFTGIALLTLVGMTVVGVDLGRLAFTATEVQAVAEVAATGYAHAWIKGTTTNGTDPGDGTCQTEALTVVDANRIDGKVANAGNIESYERGFYDYDTSGPFTTAVPNGESSNAVRATASVPVGVAAAERRPASVRGPDRARDAVHAVERDGRQR